MPTVNDECGSLITNWIAVDFVFSSSSIFFFSGLADEIASSIQDRLEEWKRSLILLDKDHSKGSVSALTLRSSFLLKILLHLPLRRS